MDPEPRAIREMLVAAAGGDEAARAQLAESWHVIVALCCTDPEARAEIAVARPHAEATAEEVEGASWVALVLGVLHEEPFVAIEPATRIGIAGRMSGIVDNFQLHTLLMDALPLPRRRFGRRAPRRVSESAAATARGDGPQETDETVVGAWNPYVYAAFAGGSLPAKEDYQAARHLFIWNEGTPADIPSLDGRRVILLGEPSYVREWPSARVFGPLRASLDARALGDDDVGRWLERCAAAAAGPAGEGRPEIEPG